MTREDALNILHNASVYHPDYLDALNMAIKSLEQEPILDKIRAEILAMMPPLGKWMYEEGYIEEQTTCEVIADVVQIIDKYKAESEKRLIDADELLKRIAEKCKTPSLSEDTVNGLCGATAIIYDMLNESEDRK